MAINEDCSKIGVAGLTDDQGKDKITLFEESDTDKYVYKVRQGCQLKRLRHENDNDHPFTFVNLTFTTKNAPLQYTGTLFCQYRYEVYKCKGLGLPIVVPPSLKFTPTLY